LFRDVIRSKLETVDPMFAMFKNIRGPPSLLSMTLAVLLNMSASGGSPTKYLNDDEALKRTTEVLQWILGRNNVVRYGLEKAVCVAVLADGGRGMMSCRAGGDFTGPWSAPTRFIAGTHDVRWQYGMVLWITPEGGVARSQNGTTKVRGVVSHTHSTWGCDPFSRCGK